MLMVISPAKTLDYTSTPVTRRFTQPEHLDQAQLLINQLRKLTPAQIAELMSLSDPLAGLNAARCTPKTSAMPTSTLPSSTCACSPASTACCGRWI